MLSLCISKPDTEGNIPSEIQRIIADFEDLFEAPMGLPPKRYCDHRIPLIEGSPPINVRPYRYNPAQKDEIERQVKEMLQNGVIQHSTSAFSSPALLVRKKDGTWRMVIDYRRLNDVTIKSKYPLPVIDELLDELHGSKYFSKLDLRSGYHQIRLVEGEEYKTAFQTHTGHYEYRVMSFGLTGAPGTFQGAMNNTLAPVLRKYALVFFDDILVYSPDLYSHAQHLRHVLKLLREHQWKVKLSKCSFGQSSLSYLGYTISSDGVSTDPSKVQAIVDWPRPETVKKLRGFLGLAGYYRKFVRNFGIISKPLTTLLKKDVEFNWTPAAESAFIALKQALVTSPVLALPDFSKQFVLETDASEVGIGAVLSQEGHPIAFVSRALGKRTRGLSTYEKECLAILLAIDHWRSYLQHGAFLIYTDHRSLTHLSEQKLTTALQHKAFTKLLGMQYTLCYKKGVANSAADALSRRDNSGEPALALVSSCKPSWLEEVIQGYFEDLYTKQIISELSINATARPDFTLSDGLLRYKGRI
ncbi:hypothetical protein GUJ93_ZPchr0005g15565 [Zizania palustris]|uniref:Reverse transcriptase domain-containing protein n=1 Tax=Zizania palustris TaxID=103762 RepID=A0A8J5SW61_ZIZPA|nr:hypothetical protein GUJ93_ZPchr0005g15565 [Zizania palustris]